MGVATVESENNDLVLSDVVDDAHLQALFLQYLSTHDKKAFARMLFLVSVDEFKKMFPTASPEVGNNSYDDTYDLSASQDFTQTLRYKYARKIIAKFMDQDSFLDIASDNLRILNKTVWSFGHFLHNDLLMCAALSSQRDLFQDAERAVAESLESTLRDFAQTDEYAALRANARISYSLVTSPTEDTLSEVDEADSPFKSWTKEAAHLTLDKVLNNRRLCSVFWIALYRERQHASLSLYLDIRDYLLPVLDSFLIDVVSDSETESDASDQVNDTPVRNALGLPPSNNVSEEDITNRIDQILDLGQSICNKYIAPDAPCGVSFVGEEDRILLLELEQQITKCLDIGSFSLTDAETLRRNVHKVSKVIEYNLRVNHFVRFMSSDSLQALVQCYQGRLLCSSPSTRHLASTRAKDTDRQTRESLWTASLSGSSSDYSMTTLQEMCHYMNVPSHQPQRPRLKEYSLVELWKEGQTQQESQLVSSVLTFHLNTTDKDAPYIAKKELHSLASKSNALHHHHSIPDHVEAFFCPSDAKVIRAKKRPLPSLFHLTIGNADKSFYAAVLTRYVRQPEQQLGPLELVLREEEGLEAYLPCGLCIISRYPILNTLKQRLGALHSVMDGDATYLDDRDWTPSPSQLESLLRPLDFAPIVVEPSRAERKLQSYVDFSMHPLFSCLRVDLVVDLVTALLMERQVVLVSSHYSVLTSAGETLRALLCPFVWSHVFAPVLPRSMLECLQCPTPFLFGIHSSYRHELDELLARDDGGESQVIVADLDNDTIVYGKQKDTRSRSFLEAEEVYLPQNTRGTLVSELQVALRPQVTLSDIVTLDPVPSAPREFPETEVRSCFQRAMTQLLSIIMPFRFVLADDFDYVVVFDRPGLLQTLNPKDASFYRNFLDTQVFSHQISTVQ